MKFRVKPKTSQLEDLEVTKFEILEEGKIQGTIALTILIAGITFLVGAALYGLFQGNFNGLKSVFNSTQGVMGVILGYYFCKREK